MHRTLVKSAVLASVMFGAGAANAEVVAFENPAPGEPGHFDWGDASGTPSSSLRWLDVRLDSNSQPAGPYSFLNAPASAFGQNDTLGGVFSSQAGPGQNGGLESSGSSSYLLIGVDAGVLIPSGAPWTLFGGGYYAGYGQELPAGEPIYLGVRFDLGSGFQYGWIGVVMDPNDFLLDVFAWGYETEPGVPIAAGAGLGTPCPGDLTGDDTVDFDDLLDLFGQWGECAPPSPCPGDLAEPADGVVNFDDLLALFAEWGECA